VIMKLQRMVPGFYKIKGWSVGILVFFQLIKSTLQDYPRLPSTLHRISPLSGHFQIIHLHFLLNDLSKALFTLEICLSIDKSRDSFAIFSMFYFAKFTFETRK